MDSNAPETTETIQVDLRRSEARYRAIFESAAVALWEVNFARAKRRIEQVLQSGVEDLAAHMASDRSFVREIMDLTIAVDVNDAGIRMLDARCKSDLLGPVGKVWPPEADADFAQTVVSALMHRPTFELQTKLRTLSGRNVDVLYSVAYPPEALSLESIFVAFADLTETNRTHAALQRAQTDLANATRMVSLGELTASIAHEISQPLAGITANGQAALRWLRRGTPDTEAAIDAVEALVGETRRVAAVISGIRALAKREALQRVDLSINGLIQETLILLRRELEGGHVALLTKLDPDVGLVSMDRVQIQQVLINLIMNAIQAMTQDGGPKRELVVSSVVEHGQVTVSVRDNGPGVDLDLRPRIFNAFVTSKAAGMGLGLSLCASIIELHGGRIWPDFEQPRGSTFSFSLPVD